SAGDIHRFLRLPRCDCAKSSIGWLSGAVPAARSHCAGEVPMKPEVTSVFDLSPAEKLQLVEDLWDDLAATPDVGPVHDWHREELSRRKANLLKNPGSGLSWEEVQRRVRSRHGR